MGRLSWSLSILALLLLSGTCTATVDRSGEEETLIFLVRHAERAEDGTDDPHISEEGRARAALLGALLGDADITHIHSTDFHRTRETAAPLAHGAGLVVDIYDAEDPKALTTRLRDTPGRHLVVGHSNTVPDLVRDLGGDPGAEIEASEYDRLYLMVLGPRGASTVLLRYGSPFRD